MKKSITFILLFSFFAGFTAPVMATYTKIPDTKTEKVLNIELLAQVFDLSFLPIKQARGARYAVGRPKPSNQPKPAKNDPLAFLKGFGGTAQANLFAGALGFDYPLQVPDGRLGVQPQLALKYSSNNRDFSSKIGYGWSLGLSNIHRISDKGVDNLYTADNFFAEINGQGVELVSIDSAAGLYGAKTETNFAKFEFTNNSWVMTDTAGTRYFLGTSLASRQENPANSAETFQWMLERVEDLHGNFMSFTYTKDLGQIYPETITYTGHGNTDGIYEVKFNLSPRPEYTEYKRGFAVTTAQVIDKIEIFSRDAGNPVLVYQYNLEHDFVNNAVSHLTQITQKRENNSLPPTSFEYYDGRETETNKKINLLKKVVYPLGAEEKFTYKPSTAYKIAGNLANRVPFIIHTLHESSKRESTSQSWQTTSYEYEGGHYYYDYADAYKKEYAGFHRVTTTDPLGNVAKSYFHQSEFSPDNINSEQYGEYADHLSKKGRLYRQELYDDADNLYQVSINKWDKLSLPDDNPDKDRYFVFLARTVQADYDGYSSPKATATEYLYDSFGNEITNKNYGEVNLTADDGSFADVQDDRIDTVTEYAQNPANYLYTYPKQVVRQDENGQFLNKVRYFYDDLAYGDISTGLVTREETNLDPQEIAIKEMDYNNLGLLLSTKNPRNYVTTLTYDTHNLYPQTVTNAKGHQTNTTYDYRFGQPSQTTDANGFVTETVYDDWGRLVETKQSDPANPANLLTKSTVQYDLTATPAQITQTIYTHNNGIDNQTVTYLDRLGRTEQIRSEAEGTDYRVVNTWYDPLDRVQAKSLPILQTGANFAGFTGNEPQTSFVYDPLGRQLSVTTPLGTTSYNYHNWQTTITDANGQTKTLAYDGHQNLVQVTENLDGNSYNTNYQYDLNKNLVKIIDAGGNEKNMTYDWQGHQLSREKLHASGANAVSWNYTYDKNGNLITTTDPNGQTITRTYDELDRILTVASSLNTNDIFTYAYDAGLNGIGRLTKVQGVTNTAWVYDIAGRPTTETKTIDGSAYKTEFSRDLLGNLLRVVYPDNAGTEVNYTYDNAGQIDQISTSTEPIITAVNYEPTGAITEIAYANGAVTTNTFDINQNYLLTNKSTVVGGQNIQNLAYSFDNVANITQIIDTSTTNTAKVANYTYDDLYRLTQSTVTDTANAADYTRNYTYDIVGNILTKSDLAGTYQYTGSHPQAVSSAGGRTFGYDANGNMTSDGEWVYSWNWQDRLSQALNSTTSEQVNYTYDHDGQRVLKNNLTNNEQTVYVNKYFAREGTEEKSFIFLGNKKVATLTGNEKIYHHEDHLTGTSVDTDQNGAVNQLLDYYPYGEERIDEQTGSYDNDYHFTGKERDDETGLMYYEARYYDPNLARFMSIDSWAGDLTDPQSLNKYSYVRNNPLKYIDPSGNVYETFWDIAVEVYNGVVGMNAMVAGVYADTVGDKYLHQVALESSQDSAKDLVVDGVAVFIPGLPAGASKLGTATKVGEKALNKADDVVKFVRNKVHNIVDSLKQSKVLKSKKVEFLGNSKYKKTTEIRPGKGPGQTRAEYIRYKNTETGRTVNSYKDVYSRGNRFEGRDPTRGGPSGRTIKDKPGNKSKFRKK